MYALAQNILCNEDHPNSVIETSSATTPIQKLIQLLLLYNYSFLLVAECHNMRATGSNCTID